MKSDSERIKDELAYYDTDEYRVSWQGEPGSHALANIIGFVIVFLGIMFLGWFLVKIGFL